MDKRQGYYQEGTFPVKLHQMLEAVTDSVMSRYVSWDPNGRSFTITDPKGFTSQIMGTFFNQTKYKSFQRQLNFYGFRRTCRGKIRGVCKSPACFQQCQLNLFSSNNFVTCHSIEFDLQTRTPCSEETNLSFVTK